MSVCKMAARKKTVMVLDIRKKFGKQANGRIKKPNKASMRSFESCILAHKFFETGNLAFLKESKYMERMEWSGVK